MGPWTTEPSSRSLFSLLPTEEIPYPLDYRAGARVDVPAVHGNGNDIEKSTLPLSLPLAVTHLTTARSYSDVRILAKFYKNSERGDRFTGNNTCASGVYSFLSPDLQYPDFERPLSLAQLATDLATEMW